MIKAVVSTMFHMALFALVGPGLVVILISCAEAPKSAERSLTNNPYAVDCVAQPLNVKCPNPFRGEN